MSRGAPAPSGGEASSITTVSDLFVDKTDHVSIPWWSRLRSIASPIHWPTLWLVLTVSRLDSALTLGARRCDGAIEHNVS